MSVALRHAYLAARRACAAAPVLFALTAPSHAVDVTYSYDALGRLTGVVYGCGASTSYAYDAAGNRSSSGAVPGCPPVAVNDSVYAAVGTPLTFDPRINDSDANGFPLTISAVGTPGHGSAAINSGVSITYTPTAGYSGADSFPYTISDGHGGTASATVSVTVSPPPVAVNDAVTTAFNTAATFDPRINDSDPSSYALAVVATSTPAHGAVTIASGGASLTYTPTTGYSGGDSFTYTISNGHGGSATATDTITVQPANVAPVAANDSVTTQMNSAVTFDPRANDSDADGDTLTITATSTPSHGTVAINSGTSLTYTPTTSYTGADSFTYTISDGHGHTATATVSVTVTLPLPQAPDANLEYTKPPLAATIDPRFYSYAGETLTITAVGTPGAGTAVIGGSGTYITYTATGGFYGTTTFTYTVTDGYGHTATGTVHVTVDHS